MPLQKVQRTCSCAAACGQKETAKLRASSKTHKVNYTLGMEMHMWVPYSGNSTQQCILNNSEYCEYSAVYFE